MFFSTEIKPSHKLFLITPNIPLSIFYRDIVSAWDTGDNSVLSWGGWGTRECFDQKKVEEWKIVIAASLTHLFSCANIPQGLAHTIALKENLYCVVLCAINKWPLLITGPPGCGKTLSFILACDTLRGRCPNHSVAFQSIVQVKKITYQCSIQSTGPEIAAVFNDAHLKQEFFEAQQPGRNLCLVGLDEAGLSPENRQALKSTHDFLGEHHNNCIDRIMTYMI
jgi:DNA polymerase III delta prime subunit